MDEPANYLMYDGDCPLCSRYIGMLRLRQTLPGFVLIDARDRPDLVEAHRAAGREINDGMILRTGDAAHFGPEALIAIASMSTPSTTINRLNARIFASPRASRMIYPWLVRGRRLLLRLLRRQKIA